MAVTLARRIAVAMLVIALCGSPAWASMPGCCAKAAATDGKTSCCCSPSHTQQAAGQSAANKSCCAKKQKSCCTHQEAASNDAPLSSLKQGAGLKQGMPNCCCKARLPLPAIPEDQARSELYSKSIPLHHDSYVTPVSPRAGAGIQDAQNLQVPAGPGFQVLLCRWLV